MESIIIILWFAFDRKQTVAKVNSQTDVYAAVSDVSMQPVSIPYTHSDKGSSVMDVRKTNATPSIING